MPLLAHLLCMFLRIQLDEPESSSGAEDAIAWLVDRASIKW